MYREEPVSFRALYLPWTLHTGMGYRSILIDRVRLHRLNAEHLGRLDLASSAKERWRGFHQALIRVKDLQGRITDKRYKNRILPEYQHSALEELVPVCRVGEVVPKHTVLHRVQKYTLLGDVTSGEVNDPANAPFMLFGLHRDDMIETASHSLLIRVPAPVHAILLDATDRARQPFGPNWYAVFGAILAAIRHTHGRIPVLAVTDDPFVQNLLCSRLLHLHDGLHKKSTVPKWARLSDRRTGALLMDPEPFSDTGELDIQVASFAGRFVDILGRIRRLRTQALKLGDADTADALKEVRETLRRCARLPIGVDALSDFVHDETSRESWRDIMAMYSAGPALDRITRPSSVLTQVESTAVRELDKDVRAFIEGVRAVSPMAPLLAATLKKAFTKASVLAVVMADAMEAEHADIALSAHPEIGPDVRKRLVTGELRFVYPEQLRVQLQSKKHRIDSLVMVSLSSNVLLEALTLRDLPQHIVVLADGDQVQHLEDRSSRLGELGEMGEIAVRLGQLASACKREIVTRNGRYAPLSWDDPLRDDDEGGERTGPRLLDFTSDDDRTSPIIRLRTRQGFIIRARPKMGLVLFEREAPANPFSEKHAQDLVPGDEICVLNQEFMETARARLHFYVEAEQVRTYHEVIQAKLESIPGDSLTEKARSIAERMRKTERIAPELHRVLDWIRVDQYLKEDVSTVQPHAPKQLEDFLAFANAIGIREREARAFWKQSVLETRSRRLSGGLKLHKAYLHILVDPYAAEAATPSRRTDIQALRALAERYVDVIEEVSEEKPR
ncbi:hypothetical protein [Myxococcus sp. AB036A]|uniref:hypothetical protein n=1 Tax=Myxococcus sp. AB036A TaxID=2562793 RepID=UPI00114711A2|nr:hypothetical protein [Myxococcus sp. AB036A]